MSYFDKITAVYDHIAAGTAMDAFEAFYAENVDMILEDGTVVAGKDANRSRELDFFSSVEAFHGMEVTAITAYEDTGKTSVESVMDVTFKGGSRVQLAQVAVQYWEGDLIIRERFYGTQAK